MPTIVSAISAAWVAMATGLRLSRRFRHVRGSRCEGSWRGGLGVARVLIDNEPVCWSGAVKNDSQKGIVNGEMHNERGWDESSRRQLRRPISANRFGTDCDKSSRDLFALPMKSGDSTERILDVLIFGIAQGDVGSMFNEIHAM